MKGTPDWAKEIMLTNPRGEYGLTPNCQRCVVAHEARMRGYDVIARPSWGEGDALRNSGAWVKAFDYSPTDFKLCAGKTGGEVIKSAEEIMRNFGEGARAIIIFKWDIERGHTIVAQCREGRTVTFGDPQTSMRAVSHKLKQAYLKSGVILLRVDNLPFTDKVKRCCMNRK